MTPEPTQPPARRAGRLVRRREIWWPTLGGWLLVLGVIGLGAWVVVRQAYPLLAAQSPAPGARILIVEGWLDPDELDQAVRTFRQGRYERVITTGGPMIAWDSSCTWDSYAHRAAGYLRANGLGDVPLDIVPAPASRQERTYLSAVMVREWLKRSRIEPAAIDLYSAGVHARRSRLLFQMALGPQTTVGVFAAVPAHFDADRWWETSAGVKAVLGEMVGMAWTHCCFWPGAPGTHEERWAVPRSAPG